MKVLLSLFMLVWASVAGAQALVETAVGVNGIWVADEARPADLEVRGNAAASLSPHVAVVGGAYYGFENSYIRSSVGARFTVTDAANANFSVGLGASYHMSSEPAIRPQEWCAEAGVGWRPWPALPRVTLVGLGAYGLETSEAHVTLGAVYKLNLP